LPFESSMKKETEKSGSRDRGEFFHRTGVIIPSEWDEGGRIVGVVFAGAEEEEFFIFPDDRGREALGMIREEVEIIGSVSDRPRIKTLRIQEIRRTGEGSSGDIARE